MNRLGRKVGSLVLWFLCFLCGCVFWNVFRMVVRFGGVVREYIFLMLYLEMSFRVFGLYRGVGGIVVFEFI